MTGQLMEVSSGFSLLESQIPPKNYTTIIKKPSNGTPCHPQGGRVAGCPAEPFFVTRILAFYIFSLSSRIDIDD